MIGERFTLDTNVLVYVVDSTAGWKQDAAIEIVSRAAETDCYLTLQSLSEFYSAATRKKIVGAADAAAQVEDWLAVFPTLTPTSRAVLAAVGHSRAGRTSYWNGLLVETAIEGGCASVISEDMHDGSTIGGAMIIRPFSADSISSALNRVLT